MIMVEVAGEEWCVSYEDGWAALHLEMPARVPRTEYSTDMAAVAERHGRTHAFVGNVDTRILLSGTRVQIRTEVGRCLAIGKSCPGFFLAVGNHIPHNTPVDGALHYQEVYEEMSRR